MKKIVSKTLVLCLVLTFILGTTVFANNQGKLVLDMGVLKIATDYDTNKVTASYEHKSDTVIATIRSIETSKVIDQYEMAIAEKSVKARSNGGYITVQLTRKYNPTSSNTTKLTVFMKAKLYHETILGQAVYTLIDIDKTNHYLSGSGPFRIEERETSVQKQSSKYADINITGVLAATKSEALSAGLSFGFLEGLGFDMSAEETSEWISRLPYNDSIRIYVD